jgi:hypothetical protein
VLLSATDRSRNDGLQPRGSPSIGPRPTGKAVGVRPLPTYKYCSISIICNNSSDMTISYQIF